MHGGGSLISGFTNDPQLEASTDRWMRWGLGLMAAMVLAFPLYRIWEPANRSAARDLQQASLAAQGQETFSLSCTACHGLAGEGIDAPALNSQQFLGSATDEQIRLLISVGVPGTAMNAYSIDFGGPLTSEQVRAVVTFLRSWEPDAPDRPDWRTPGQTVTTAAGGHEP